MIQHSNLLTLDDAAQQLGIHRKTLSSSISALNLKTIRGSDRRAYLTSTDIERIQEFRSGASKSNPVYQGFISYTNAPQPQMMPRNYKSYAKEGYREDQTLYKSASYILTNGAAIPPKLFTDARMQDTIDSHPLLDLLETPNNEQSGVDYRESVIGHLIIAGNSFQLASRVTRKNGPPDELWILPPHLVHPVLAKPRGIVGYNFDLYEEKDNPIAPENIRHDKFWSPDDPIWGMSPVEPIALLIDQNMAARKWNLSVLQNGGRMDGAWVAPIPMDVNARRKLEGQLQEKYRGYSNAGKAPVLDAGMAFQPTAYTPTELDWLESIRRNESGIANALNIPPQLIGDTSATTYNNMGEAKASSYTEEIFPVLDRIYAGWRHWLVPMYPDLCDAKGKPKGYLYYDKTTVEVVQQVIQAQKEAQFKRAVLAWFQGAITLNEAREICGLPPIPDGDVFRFGAILVRSSEIDKYAEQSLITPAAAPMPQPEPLDVPPENANEEEQQGKQPAQQEEEGNNARNSGNNNTDNADNSTPSRSRSQPKPGKERTLPLETKKSALADFADDGTHGMWECGPGACAFCLENDGEVVPLGDEFPNGCTSPEDCHNYCKCQMHVLSIPDDADTSGLGKLALATLFGIGVIAAAHRHQEQDDTSSDTSNAEYADEEDDDEEKSITPHSLTTHLERKRRREEYQQFMEEVL